MYFYYLLILLGDYYRFVAQLLRFDDNYAFENSVFINCINDYGI